MGLRMLPQVLRGVGHGTDIAKHSQSIDAERGMSQHQAERQVASASHNPDNSASLHRRRCSTQSKSAQVSGEEALRCNSLFANKPERLH